jgi:hypothetical protein
MRSRNTSGRGRPWALGLVLLSLLASKAGAQGPAPETAPPLFPGGGLISCNSIFITRGPISIPSGNIPVTARPTFSHEGDFNFTWGFYRDFDLTVLVAVVTNHFGAGGNSGIAVSARQVPLLPAGLPRWNNPSIVSKCVSEMRTTYSSRNCVRF